MLLNFIPFPPSQYHHVLFQLKLVPLKLTLDVLISDINIITGMLLESTGMLLITAIIILLMTVLFVMSV